MMRPAPRLAAFLVPALLLGACALLYGTEAALVLEDLAAGAAPSTLKARTPAPPREAVSYRAAGRAYRADLYRPAEGPRAGLVLVPGLAEQGREDPRIVALASTLGRVGFQVLVPDLPGLRRFEVLPGHVGDIAAAFERLAAGPGMAADTPLGIGAFSYAAGPAVLAARRPAVRGRIDFVLAVGGYYDLDEVMTFVTTGYYRADGAWRHRTPHPYARWAFVLANAERVADPRDRALLERMARRKLADPQAPIAALARELGPAGRAVHALLTNDDPERVPALLERLPAPIRRALRALDLADKDLGALRARLLLVHGPEDDLIPYNQSVDLAKAAPRAELFLVPGLAHVDLHPERLDRAAALGAIAAVLARRAPADAPDHAHVD